MKKLIALLLSLGLIASLLIGCSGGAEEAPAEEEAAVEETAEEAAEPAEAEEPAEEASGDISVALILPGVITDDSWCSTAKEGLDQIEGMGYKTGYVESVDASACEAQAINFVEEGYTLTIAHGSQFGDAMIRVAEQFPDNYFFVYGKPPVDEYPDNIGFVDVAVFQACYACGYLAAKESESGIIGYIAGLESPGQLSMMNGFIQGAKAVNPDIDVRTTIAGNTDDTALGKESALTMINAGADVIMHAADTTGLGVIDACVEQNVKCIGYGSDQHDQAPEQMLTSVVEIVPPVIASQVDLILSGEFGGVYRPGLGVGVELAPINADIVDADIVSEMEGVVADIESGAITVDEIFDMPQ